MSEVLDIAKKDGRWVECPSCSEILTTKKVIENLWVCHHCDHHFRLNPQDRIRITCDEGTFVELESDDHTGDDRDDAIVCGEAEIKGSPCHLGIMDFSHMGGSMGVALAQRLIQVMTASRKGRKPLILFTASGGVRIQEGIWGLLQMIRTVHARDHMKDSPLITVFTDPTTGGVSASFAALGDILLAEPLARIGFAGPRVIQSTVQCSIPPKFQDAETLLSNGLIDRIVHRRDLRDVLSFFLRWF